MTVSVEIAHAIRDSQEANVMNANQTSLGKSVTHVLIPSLIFHHARVHLSKQLVYCILKPNPILECKCNPDGSTTLECDSNGDCSCKNGFVGQKCDASGKTFERYRI